MTKATITEAKRIRNNKIIDNLGKILMAIACGLVWYNYYLMRNVNKLQSDMNNRFSEFVDACANDKIVTLWDKFYVCLDVTEEVLAATGGETIVEGE